MFLLWLFFRAEIEKNPMLPDFTKHFLNDGDGLMIS